MQEGITAWRSRLRGVCRVIKMLRVIEVRQKRQCNHLKTTPVFSLIIPLFITLTPISAALLLASSLLLASHALSLSVRKYTYSSVVNLLLSANVATQPHGVRLQLAWWRLSMSHQFAARTQTHSLTLNLSLILTDVSLHNHQQRKYRGYLQQRRQSDSVAVVTRLEV